MFYRYMPVKITVKELAATYQVFYRKIYGLFSQCKNVLMMTTLTWQAQICFLGFIWYEFMELVEDVGVEVNKWVHEHFWQ